MKRSGEEKAAPRGAKKQRRREEAQKAWLQKAKCPAILVWKRK